MKKGKKKHQKKEKGNKREKKNIRSYWRKSLKAVLKSNPSAVCQSILFSSILVVFFFSLIHILNRASKK